MVREEEHEETRRQEGEKRELRGGAGACPGGDTSPPETKDWLDFVPLSTKNGF